MQAISFEMGHLLQGIRALFSTSFTESSVAGHWICWMALPARPAPDPSGDAGSAAQGPEESPDHVSFEQVYSECFDFVWRAARGMGMSGAAAEDVVQDVFVVVHRRLDSLENPAALRSWLFGITRRVVKDHRRAATRRGPHVELDAERAGESGPDPQRVVSGQQALGLLQRYVEGFDEDRKALFFLAFIEELPIVQVAEALGDNVNTVYSRVRALKRDLAAALADDPTSEKP